MGCGQSAKKESPKAAKSGSSSGAKKPSDQPDAGGVKKPTDREASRTVLGKYKLSGGREDIMGKGTSSICRKGVEISSGRSVAIKLYKEQQGGAGKVKDTTMQKFKRQITVLKELMEPFPPQKDPTLWSDVLAAVQPAQIFMQLIDYSKGADGQPGPDPNDGMLYVVTELAQYSLKDFLADRREKSKTLSKEAVRDLSKRMVLAMAGLHAKGLVHIDMKPENMMVFDGRLKVIDVDGCVRTGTKVSINDGSISFSPCYCAPEWARFMIKDNEQSINATPALDVWSVGMTLCELITLDAIWKPQYANFMRNANSHREAGFLFLEWLGDIKKPPLPRSVEKFDQQNNGENGLVSLLLKWFLVCNSKHRKTCAQALDMPYLAQGGWSKYNETKPTEGGAGDPSTAIERVPREKRMADASTAMPEKKGPVFKLNSNGDVKDNAQWIKRDMYLTSNHALCYFSQKENKRLVLIDSEKLISAKIEEKHGETAKPYAILIASRADAEEKIEKVYLGFDEEDEMKSWLEALKMQEAIEGSFRLGKQMAEDVAKFKITVQNRRVKVPQGEDGFEPRFKANLYKLKAEGDRSKEEEWFLRIMWISKNGSLVYYSEKEERDLVYYTAKDIQSAKIEEIPDSKECRAHAFTIHLQNGDAEYAPGIFAAETLEKRTEWMMEFKKHSG